MHGGVVELAPVFQDGGEVLFMPHVLDDQVRGVAYAAGLEQLGLQRRGVGSEDADLLGGLDHGADPGHHDDGGQGHRDVQGLGHFGMEIAEKAAGRTHGADALVLDHVLAQFDDVVGYGIVRREQAVDVQPGHAPHTHGEVVGIGVDHVAGDEGIVNVLDVDDAHRIAGDLLMIQHLHLGLDLILGYEIAVLAVFYVFGHRVFSFPRRDGPAGARRRYVMLRWKAIAIINQFII